MNCIHCDQAEPSRECGNGCGTLYCGEECAEAHWIDAAHYELCEARAGGQGGGQGGGERWIQKMHLKKGALTRTAQRHHMTTKGFERWAESHPTRISDKTMKRVHLAETFAKMHHRKK